VTRGGFAIPENNYCGHNADGQVFAQLGAFIDVHFGKSYFGAEFFFGFRKNRRERAAGPAPNGGKDGNYRVMRGVEQCPQIRFGHGHILFIP
jgi:hypothetical protein